MVHLNGRQRKVLALVAPANGTEGFLKWLEEPGRDLHGLTVEDVAVCLDEFKHRGLVTLEVNDEGTDFTLFLSTSLASYFEDAKAELARKALDRLFQLLAGASGGLAVALLQHFLAP